MPRFGLAVLAVLAAAGARGDVGAVARFAAGAPAVEQGLRFVRMAPIDGAGRAETRTGRACLSTDWAANNGYLYFDVSRAWLRRHGEPPYRVEMAVTYLDEGADRIAVQVDAMGADVADNFREEGWSKAGTGAWRTRTLTLAGCEFRNAQHGLADFRVGAGPDGDESIAEITLRVLAASGRGAAARPAPAPRFVAPAEQSVSLAGVRLRWLSPPTEPEGIAAARFRTRLEEVGARRHVARSGALLLVGRWRSDCARRYPRTAALVARLRADGRAFRRRDGYVVCVERGGRAATVCAVALHPAGAANALAHLQRSALRDGPATALRLPIAPRLEAPELDRREVYLNIGYGLGRPGITVETWDLARWRRYIDDLCLARYNAWSFYLWGDCELIHPAARLNASLNLRVHETLREAIRYAHRRGLRVGMHFSPSMAPREIWDANPAFRARLEYTYPGTICPSNPAARPLMEEVYGGEIRWFAECDFFSVWFYDVGGCFCETCRQPERQLASLLWQVGAFGRIVREANPGAEYQVMAWAIWRYERMHGYSLRDRFVAEARKAIADAGLRASMADGAEIDPGCAPLFPQMRREGLPQGWFLYQTNIETGQPFPLLLSRYFERRLPQAAAQGARGAFLMRIEAGSKLADDLLAGEYLWRPTVGRADALLTVARAVTGDRRAAEHAREALARMDDFAWFGLSGERAGAAKGERILRAVRAALSAAPFAPRSRLDWLQGAGEAYAILGAAAEAREAEDEPVLRLADRRFAAAMGRIPLFRGQAAGAPYWQELFMKSLVRYFQNGFRSMAF